MAASLSPNFERKPTLDDIVEKYGSAKEAFERGNYYVSLIKAQKEDNSHIQAASAKMCGSRVTSLGITIEKDSIEDFFSKWCSENTEIKSHQISKAVSYTHLRAHET